MIVAGNSVAFADHVPAPRASPSDDRAEFFEGNIKSCSDAPLDLETPPTMQVGANRDNPASDANVSGTVTTNSGEISPGQGEELNVTITGGADVVIDAVVIKAGDGFNVYRDPESLPPTLTAPQHYIGPLVGAGNVPDISHWFICYHIEPQPDPPTGSLSVIKTVVRPAGVPAEPLPTAFTVDVTCTLPDATEETATVTFGSGGGAGDPTPALEGLPVGTVCTVVEQGTDAFPDGAVVTYNPPEATTTGVAIGGEPVVVEVVNDFSDVEVRTGSLEIFKVVEPGGVPLPDTLTVHVACTTPDAEDDDVIVDVSVPGTGGEGTPVLELPAGTHCTLAEETDTLPEGTVVTYQVGDGEPTTETPVHSGRIVADTAITVTITNTAPQPEPPPPGPPEPPEPTPPDVLPDTGITGVGGLLMIATVLVSGGGLARIAAVVRRRANRLT